MNYNKNQPNQSDYPVSHSRHSHKRASQRAITDEDIQFALDASQSFFKQGLIFHVVKDKLISDKISESMKKRIQHMVIVIAGDSNQILTCYKSRKAMHHI
ncbi:MAG: hypothetical protein U9N86_00840, partial [Bacteroidota bacterium]|nr:hypothetical protein [Bacteroidota bacterium]